MATTSEKTMGKTTEITTSETTNETTTTTPPPPPPPPTTTTTPSTTGSTTTTRSEISTRTLGTKMTNLTTSNAPRGLQDRSCEGLMYAILLTLMVLYEK